MLTEKIKKEIEIKASHLRKHIVRATCKARSGHPGGSLSLSDIVAVLYFYWMKIDSNNPDWEERDYFVLAKGHAAPVLYAALAEKGFFPMKELDSLRQIDSLLQGHPDMKIPGVEVSTGSLGQGLSVMTGMALALKQDKKTNGIFGAIGDGECQEGQVWEAAMAASHFELDNLVVFLDKNGLQIDGPTKDIMDIDPIKDKFIAFGWETIEIDAHNVEEIVNALKLAKNNNGKPKLIIANSIKGRGVSFMEHQLSYHGAPCKDEQLEQAISDLEIK